MNSSNKDYKHLIDDLSRVNTYHKEKKTVRIMKYDLALALRCLPSAIIVCLSFCLSVLFFFQKEKREKKTRFVFFFSFFFSSMYGILYAASRRQRTTTNTITPLAVVADIFSFIFFLTSRNEHTS